MRVDVRELTVILFGTRTRTDATYEWRLTRLTTSGAFDVGAMFNKTNHTTVSLFRIPEAYTECPTAYLVACCSETS